MNRQRQYPLSISTWPARSIQSCFLLTSWEKISDFYHPFARSNHTKSRWTKPRPRIKTPDMISCSSWLYLPCILTVLNFIPISIRGYSRRDVRVKATAQQRELWKHQIYWGDIRLLIYIDKIVTDICGKRHYLTRLNKQPSSPLVLYRQYQDTILLHLMIIYSTFLQHSNHIFKYISTPKCISNLLLL